VLLGRAVAHVDQQRRRDAREDLRLLRQVDHRGRGADGEQHVGGDLGHDGVRHAVDERRRAAHGGEYVEYLEHVAPYR
jgi:hypothetical protein